MEVTNTETTELADIGYAILELMGHRRLGGYVREARVAGAAMIRIDIPRPDAGCWKTGATPTKEETLVTSFYSPTSMYGLTQVEPQMAQAVAKLNTPPPVSRYEMQAAGLLPEPANNQTVDVADVESFDTDDDDYDPR